MSRKTFWSGLLLLALFLTGCGGAGSAADSTPTLAVTPTLPAPVVNTTQAPDTEAAARAFLEAWENEDYSAMYSMLTKVSQDAITAEQFEAKYREIAAEAALSGVRLKYCPP